MQLHTLIIIAKEINTSTQVAYIINVLETPIDGEQNEYKNNRNYIFCTF